LATRTVEGSIPGAHVVFESFPGIELALERLDSRQGRIHPELISVREVGPEGSRVEQATVFVPDGKMSYFLGRVEKYLATVATEKPRNFELVDRIQRIRRASLRELWTDSEPFPTVEESRWWELWLRRRDGLEMQRLRQFADGTQMLVATRTLAFPGRVVALVWAAVSELGAALRALDDFAELRRPREPAEFIASEPPVEQAAWIAELRARTTAAARSAPAACIIDTGIHQSHPLLDRSLAVDDCHSCNPGWPSGDRDGHGTEMAGLGLYGDLGAAISSSDQIRLRHLLESVKILGPQANRPEEYGALTATSASLVEIQAPERRRVFVMAVSAKSLPPDPGRRATTLGQPSSWSAAIDALGAGMGISFDDDGMVFLNDQNDQLERRLFILAGGNIERDKWQRDYLTRCDLEPVEDPGQAWNAVTVGAFSERVVLDPNDRNWDDWSAIGAPGELSPHSRTSVTFARKNWPVKPDILMEGGNIAISPDAHSIDTPQALQLLTTNAPLRNQRLLTVTSATSASTAQAAHLGASILAEYPAFWPETVRALMVHSAEWTPAMRRRLDAAPNNSARDSLRRRYGMGVADRIRAIRSAADALTLVAQDSIQPFDDQGRMREMNLHDLPWPTDALAELGGAEVRLRITLSYFVEPSPGSRGWTGRYSYASHGLRFDVRRSTESNEEFRERVNQLARSEEERRPARAGSDSSEWYIGHDYRTSGSLITDIWTGTAADLAQRGAVAVFPVTGWWKYRRIERQARYALVVSIETPNQDVDIWTPVATQVGISVVVESQ